MMKRKFVWGIVFIVVVALAVYGYIEFNRTSPDLKDVPPKFSVSATDLLTEFERGQAAAENKYVGLNVVLEVNGTVKGMERAGQGQYTILLGNTAKMSSVRCSMDSSFSGHAQAGTTITVKGYFNGYKPDDLGLGSDVELNRCVVIKKE